VLGRLKVVNEFAFFVRHGKLGDPGWIRQLFNFDKYYTGFAKHFDNRIIYYICTD
jgi:hypothetical protein